MRRVARIVGGSLLAIVAIVAAAAFAYRAIERPRIDGTLAVAGLSAPVDVVRDAAAIPHLYAASEDDAWFALGYVHAQDRLWQMELDRRTAAGRLAEVLGEPAVQTDRFLRTIGVGRNAQAIARRLDAATLHRLERYAAGVNANLDARRALWPVTAPIEFVLLRAPMPEPWTPADSIGWVTMMAWDLSGNVNAELMRMRLSERLTKRQIDEFLPPYPGNAPAGPDPVLPTADYVALYRGLRARGPSLTRAVDDVERGLVAMGPLAAIEGKGSNNWVVSGARTTSGKPLLANDPHLGLSAPSLWYFAQVSWPGHDTIGATLPGVPFVVIGRNRRIGWGLTNTGPDTQDLFIEDLRTHDGVVEARTPDGWQPLATRHETIRVKGGTDVDLVVRTSRHGPLLSDVSTFAKDAVRSITPTPAAAGADGAGHAWALAFQWAALRPDDRTMAAGFAIGQATDWTGFVDALRDFHAPEQNFVYADVDGHIGFVAPGRVPLRRPDNDLRGLAPAPGWDARYDWAGFVPFDALPRVFDPANGRIVTANHKVVADDDAVFLTSEWAPPFRARRIEQLIDATPRHDVASFARIQSDVTSLAVVRLLPLLLATPPADDAQKAAIAKLSAWDGTMAADRAEPLIYAAWMRELTRLVMRDELGPTLFADYWDQRTVFMIDVLSDVGGQSRWCDDVATPAVETCAQMQSKALGLALADLERRIGPDRAGWRWDRLHDARSEHRPFGRVPRLAPLFDLRTPVGGDSNTIDVAGYAIANDDAPFVDRHGPSLRQILDFADLERSRVILTTGESGDRLSPHYADQVDRWRTGESVPMQLERASVERGAIGTLRLTP